MIVWQVESIGVTAELSLDVENGNEAEAVQFKGDADLIECLKQDLSRSSGAFGHSIYLDSTTAIDIDSALHDLPSFYEVTILKGKNIVESYEVPGLEEGDLL
ncbi:hypothetical protein NIES2135_20690 [Leptolyngbya boryana NIES-2135]|jgi:hypothetical protein|uniref:Uncharacterized protein n=1 Tax=Leptolyngbya boryana NIES-2135 TaxID=1973484 RepID=A0A1Z4JET2_LEPBY|nr:MULTISPECIES: hypothetical protein [Leptolyngbya]BAY55246.1 hypothetical protein NIES2135_20690 [Leptolyngbya boryana NIES-2135]MBD2369331.1 hypothetical protein [Leptolyngbya sp. FACHB-161]MBD2375667.1 hypothetical protein [Leptolyngbya sp. FACHB-238]MBD2401660.1 hypothetical protein [Leptolyngbya sp. FACHB-239]MBD2406601.1 hypothetical protein [Leptolyngbya sp. FACHB-402]